MNRSERLDQLVNQRLYAITCPPPEGVDYLTRVEQLCLAGIRVLQFREKELPPEKLRESGRAARGICRAYGALFIVNDSVDLALELDADGVHLGQKDGSPGEARLRLGFERLIGRSTHSLEQAVEAEREGADYIGVGPVFATPTKPDYPPIGLSMISVVRSVVNVPQVVIGGIDLDNLGWVVAGGAERVAMVRALFGSPSAIGNVKRAHEIFREKEESIGHV